MRALPSRYGSFILSGEHQAGPGSIGWDLLKEGCQLSPRFQQKQGPTRMVWPSYHRKPRVPEQSEPELGCPGPPAEAEGTWIG